jgi:hypothetical protein
MGWRKPSVTREELISSYQRYRRLYASLRMPRGFRWAQPYVAMMAELMSELEIR